MKTQLALFGFGVVGEGVYQLCEQHPELQLRVKAIAVKHKNKKRKAPTSLFVKNNDVQLQDDSIDLFIEVIDDEAESYRIVKTLLLTGKKVISANKKMLAHHLTELRTLEKTHGGCLLYEAAVCASIPVIRTLDTSFNPQLLSGLEGILNGSCNYILTRMHQQSCSFETALKEAQQEGFAESDPHLDISGTDSINKLCILIRHAFGLSATPDELFFKGIESIPLSTIQWAQSKGYCIKLLARAQQSENGIIATVLPTLVQNNATLAAVHHEWNGLIISSKGNDCQFLCGKGAGRLPTALAILHDALGIENGYHYTDRSNEVSLGDSSLQVQIEFPSDWNDVSLDGLECISPPQDNGHRKAYTIRTTLFQLKKLPWIKRKEVLVLQWPSDQGPLVSLPAEKEQEDVVCN